MSDVAKLEVEGKVYELPIIRGVESNEKAIDISKLRANSGFITMDPGFMNTGSCVSSITYLDGEKGVLRYRGYSIEDLAENSNFMEVCYLLIWGELPNKEQYQRFQQKLFEHSKVPESLKKFFDLFPKEAHPMGVLSALTASLNAFYPEYLRTDWTEEAMEDVMIKMIAQIKIFAAYFYRKSNNLPFVESDPKRGYCNDFINMMFSDGKGYQVDDDVAKALNTLLILHADHEQNCSTSAVRLVGSSQAYPFACVSAGIDALWGPLHGGANQAVIEMLEAIHKDGGDYNKFINMAKDKTQNFRLMGFGHRVYKNFDPRSRFIKKLCDLVLQKLGVKDPLLDIAKGLAQEALQDEYFTSRKLYPNVDFYSGIIYRSLGIPMNMFTVMFAIGRLPGWLAQWREMILDSNTKICRPRQIYLGLAPRGFIPMDKR